MEISVKISLISLFAAFQKKVRNNFSTLKSVENVENFLSKKCDFGSSSLGLNKILHKFSTHSNNVDVENPI